MLQQMSTLRCLPRAYVCCGPKREHKKTPIAMMGASIKMSKPIIQALAPCLLAGCCAVNELVSHALFMVTKIIDLFFSVVKVFQK